MVEPFESEDELGSKSQAALAEISGRQVGMQAMTTATMETASAGLGGASAGRGQGEAVSGGR